MRTRREKRPEISEGMRSIILSRIFGESYTENPDKEGWYVGYCDGMIVEVEFESYSCTIYNRKSDFKEVKFGNFMVNRFFDTRGLRCSSSERINFDKETSAHFFYDKEWITFIFWYRTNKNKAV